MKVCLDTNAYGALVSGKDPHRADRVQGCLERAGQILIPAVVVGELIAGFRIGKRERENRQLFTRFLDKTAAEILPVDEAVAEAYALVFKDLHARGKPIPTNDLWIAATCMGAGAALLTFDKHFEQVPGLLLVPA